MKYRVKFRGQSRKFKSIESARNAIQEAFVQIASEIKVEIFSEFETIQEIIFRAEEETILCYGEEISYYAIPERLTDFHYLKNYT